MKLVGILPLALCIAARAVPTPQLLGLGVTSTVAQIRSELNSLGLSLASPVSELVIELGLDPSTDDLASLLNGLVGDVDGLLNEVDSTLDGLLGSLGLGSVTSTIDEVEGALGISSDDSIRSLLNALGVL